MFVLHLILVLFALFVSDVHVAVEIILNKQYNYTGLGHKAGGYVCTDPLLPLLLGTTNGNYYGCCSVKPSDEDESRKVCCLLGGSLCDPTGQKGPQPCKGVPCCGVDYNEDLNASRVRYVAGRPDDLNLRQRAETSIHFNRDRDPTIILNKDPSVEFITVCQDPNRKKNKKAMLYGMKFNGCCRSDPKTPQQSASECCLVSSSACDGTIPCCNDMPCVLGKCPSDAGFVSDKELSGLCRYANHGKTVPNSTKKTPFNGAKTIKACDNPALPVGYNLTATGFIVCCRAKVKVTSAAIARRSCCIQGGSPCDNSIDCCSGMPCCGGICPANSGNSFLSEVINFPQTIC